jgi:hypothetical protein
LSTFIDKVVFDKFLGIMSIPKWSVGFILYNALSWIEKDDDLAEIIWMSKVGYANPFKLAWDAWNWNLESTKGKREKEMQAMCKYHESKMIHGQ